jgi:hypothetical protein
VLETNPSQIPRIHRAEGALFNNIGSYYEPHTNRAEGASYTRNISINDPRFHRAEGALFRNTESHHEPHTNRAESASFTRSHNLLTNHLKKPKH